LSGFFGHPAGLSTLFFTEMWERFTFYGMRALLVLFLVDAVQSGGYGLDDKTATAIYGLYTAAVFMAALPGGWIADRLIGAQQAVIAGGPGTTSIRLPTVISTPPAITACCAPISRSAIQPPGSAAMNTAAVYRP
jgi:hypothetical protein